MKRVLGKDLKVGDTSWYRDERQWTVVEAPSERPGHSTGYGLSLLVELPNEAHIRISIGREQSFQIG